MSDVGTYRLALGSDRRPSLPDALLDEAGLPAAGELVAYVAGPGRIVLEAPGAALARLRAAVAEGKRRRRRADDLETSLFTDRSADASRE
ncbi:hypothetical protein LX15_001763 [Streptoalloteichus tenebrarius]|uniref:SpoVT-AbrB domain-containing protein n=1 Tax=Streptoalloteichus tenebrarius (strain ATCC 17920 / DSM 40477 / JCM 4838 / CBS 697.72 / NBRC 16177 / NCIMB 11028 / NRRL B-12390 / A12253. 1 / ISP 5477) TaxID=1933 RepID=A0ABT1HRD0_STRSD|nr:hypothetical protein [Streptoalloteichus tenebrarius]MCP2258076.1 hypothetical protein [Streptoalloteichus tenebrarius]BFF01747.1 hypothetical protein GCM10020241_34220 [Streptoalloteichus tenebrarius]